MIVIIGFIIFTATLIADVSTDLKLWEEKKPINHKRGAILRLIGLIPASVCLAFPNIVSITASIPLVGFGYWLLFDGLFNVSRGFDWWFTGTNDPDDAKTDNFLQKIPKWLHAVIKIGGTIVSLFFYVYLLIE